MYQTRSALESRLHDETQRLLALATPLFRQAGRKTPELELRFDLRGRSAGQVIWQEGRPVQLRYNLALAEAQPEGFIAQTVPHEVAHVVAGSCFRDIRPHGREWRAVMQFFGIADPQRCHRFAVPEAGLRRQRRWSYRCACRQHQLSTTRHRRAQRDSARYLCRRCGKSLIYQPQARKEGGD